MRSSTITRMALLFVALLLIVSCSKGGGQAEAGKPTTPAPQAVTKAPEPRVEPTAAAPASAPRKLAAGKKTDPADPPYNNGITQPGAR